MCRIDMAEEMTETERGSGIARTERNSETARNLKIITDNGPILKTPYRLIKELTGLGDSQPVGAMGKQPLVRAGSPRVWTLPLQHKVPCGHAGHAEPEQARAGCQYKIYRATIEIE